VVLIVVMMIVGVVGVLIVAQLGRQHRGAEVPLEVETTTGGGQWGAVALEHGLDHSESSGSERDRPRLAGMYRGVRVLVEIRDRERGADRRLRDMTVFWGAVQCDLESRTSLHPTGTPEGVEEVEVTANIDFTSLRSRPKFQENFRRLFEKDIQSFRITPDGVDVERIGRTAAQIEVEDTLDAIVEICGAIEQHASESESH